MIKIAPLLMFAISSSVIANPLGFEEYKQKITVEFASEKDAKEGRFSILPLYNGKEIAFSTRWDDSNPRHTQMSQLLKKHKLKGNFYLNKANDEFYQKNGRGFLADGNAIGAHTIDHPHLPTLSANEISRQIMMQRPILESAMDCSVMSFVLPYCEYDDAKDPKVKKIVRDSILRAGFYACPEYWPNLATRYNTSVETIFGTHLFSANDKEPSKERFVQLITKCSDAATKNTHIPHVTFGLHTWQSDEGLEVLGKCFEKYNKNPQWWYCNENEYGAYRYQFYHSKIKVLERKGNKVEYEINRISPRDLGDNISLSTKISTKVLSLKVDGSEVLATENGLYNLPQNSKYAPPTKIAYLDTTKFPDIEFSIHYERERNELECYIVNNSNECLDNLNMTVRLPVKWTKGVVSMPLKSLATGEKHHLKIDLGEMSKDTRFEKDALHILAQCDFIQKDVSGRIFTTTVDEQR